MKSRIIVLFQVALMCLVSIKLNNAQSAKANEVIGCGGFIKSNTEINYKIIKVKLLTKEGAVKYTTEASPVNGYYMIPIYNNGEYILQVSPPPGWSFEPTQVNINVDGKTDPCSKNEDINFHFKGFGLSGKVITQGDAKNNGPSGIKLNLLMDNKVIDSTVSGPNGNYHFSNVMPGSYKVEASHPTIDFLSNKVNVVLSKDNWAAKNDIIVSGFKIEGIVQLADKSPVQDVSIELHFDDQSYANINTKNFVCQPSKDNLKICYVKTDANGRYSFANIAFGKYKLTASFSKDHISFTMHPASIQADLTKNQNIVIRDTFKLNSLSIKSQALLAENGKPLTNGEIFINDQKLSTKISADGKFELSKLVNGIYKIKVKAEQAYFDEKVLNIDLSNSNSLKLDRPDYKQVSKFVAKSFDVCGQIKINKNDQQLSSNPEILKDLSNLIEINIFQQDKLVISTKLDKDLKYCVELNSGITYLIKAELKDKLANVVKLVPAEKKITVTDGPLMNVNFERLEANLNGKILLLGNKGLNDLMVTIKTTSNAKAASWSKDLIVTCPPDEKSNDDKKASESKFKMCTFSVTNLLFGEYQLITNYDDLFCFKSQQETSNSNTVLITINSEDQNIVIEQVGYKLNYELSHKNVLLKIGEDLNKALKDKILFSRNIVGSSDLKGSFCLPKIAKYVLLFESCHKFTDMIEADYILIEPSFFAKNSNKLVLNALKNKMTIDVVLKIDPEDQSLQKNNIKSEDIIVEVSSKNSDNIELVKLDMKVKSKNEIIFSGLSYYAPNQLIKLKPQSNKVLFESDSEELTINEFNCDLNHVQFEASFGIFIIGSIKPNNIDSIDLTLKSTLDNSVIQQSIINADKGFKLGPLRSPYSKYQVELAKTGFLFNRVKGQDKQQDDAFYLNFSAEKLGQLNVNVLDSKLKSNLENVLLSLSSEDRLFRQTLKTDPNGVVSFVNLKPGLYYLIVMMQEYEFTPNSHPIQITDGFDMNLNIEAKRIAYSIFGKVTSINGQPEEDATVEAIGVNGNSGDESCELSRESASVESGGKYRIRNLKPKCQYEIDIVRNKVNQTESQILKVLPENYRINIEESDVSNLNFIILEKFERIDLSLAITYRPQNALTRNDEIIDLEKLNNFVRIKLFKTNQPDQILQTQYIQANSIFYLNRVPRDESQHYSIQVELLASTGIVSNANYGQVPQQQQAQLQQAPVLQKTELGFYADSAHKHLVASFVFDKTKINSNYYSFDPRQHQYQNVYFTFPLFVLIVGVLLNTKKAQVYLNNLNSYAQQRGGYIKLIQSLVNSQQQNSSNTTSSSLKTKYQRSNKDTGINSSDLSALSEDDTDFQHGGNLSNRKKRILKDF